MKKLEEFEKWMKAGETLEATYDRATAWAAWTTAWDSAISEATKTFWEHDSTIRRISMIDSRQIARDIRELSR